MIERMLSSPSRGPAVPRRPTLSQLSLQFKRLPEFSSLTSDQVRFIDAFFSGQNLFLSGAAGTGKSFVLQLLFSFLQDNQIAVGKTALTGVAAFNIGGQTLHSWAGLGLAEEDIQTLIGLVGRKKKAVARIAGCQVLIIDEVSMAKAELLDKLDMVMKYYRFNGKPFGGVQLLFVGDLLQLAPVWRGGESQNFGFRSRSWKEATITTVVLKKIMRQVHDPRMAESLNRLRVGDPSGLDLIRMRVGAVFPKSDIEPVRIFCKNVDVDKLNADKLRALAGDAKTFHALDNGEPYHTEHFNKNCPAPQTLHLKVGAQVMLLVNEDVSRGLVNGSLGVVTSFTTKGPVVKFESDSLVVEPNQWEIKEQEAKKGGGFLYKIVATRVQIPLKLAWASTVHKCQGMTLDQAIVDMTGAFTTGMVYVALSRVRNLESLSIIDFDDSKVQVSRECLAFYEEHEAREKETVAGAPQIAAVSP